jgi:hypothetical protein
MNDLLFRVDSRDPLTFTAVAAVAAVAAILAVVSPAACYVPAGRAARVNPMAPLRCL